MNGYLLKKSASRAGRDATNNLYRKVSGKEKDLIKKSATKDDTQNIQEKVEKLEIDLTVLRDEIDNYSQIHADRDFFKLLEELESILVKQQQNIDIEIPYNYISLLEEVTSSQKINNKTFEKLEIAQEYITTMLNNIEKRVESLEIDFDISQEQINQNILDLARVKTAKKELELRKNYESTYNLAKKRLEWVIQNFDQRSLLQIIKELENILSLIKPLGLDIIIEVNYSVKNEFYIFTQFSTRDEVVNIFNTAKVGVISFLLSDEIYRDKRVMN